MKIEIEKEKAKKLYPVTPEWFQDILKSNFGEDVFKKKNWNEIKTFADVCEACGTTEEEFNKKWQEIGFTVEIDIINYEKCKLVAKAINQGWEPNWDNDKEKKWYPWFRLSSEFGFAASNFSYVYAATYASSRLCYKSKEKSDYAAKQFLEIYKSLLK